MDWEWTGGLKLKFLSIFSRTTSLWRRFCAFKACYYKDVLDEAANSLKNHAGEEVAGICIIIQTIPKSNPIFVSLFIQNISYFNHAYPHR